MQLVDIERNLFQFGYLFKVNLSGMLNRVWSLILETFLNGLDKGIGKWAKTKLSLWLRPKKAAVLVLFLSSRFSLYFSLSCFLVPLSIFLISRIITRERT